MISSLHSWTSTKQEKIFFFFFNQSFLIRNVLTKAFLKTCVRNCVKAETLWCTRNIALPWQWKTSCYGIRHVNAHMWGSYHKRNSTVTEVERKTEARKWIWKWRNEWWSICKHSILVKRWLYNSGWVELSSV